MVFLIDYIYMVLAPCNKGLRRKEVLYDALVGEVYILKIFRAKWVFMLNSLRKVMEK